MRRSTIALLAIVLAAGVLTAVAMRRTSVTFDEILLPAAGARGYATGAFDLVTDHPPVLQYVYGLPVFLAGVNYPSEQVRWDYHRRYLYARAFYWQSDNDPERVAFIARLAAVLIAAGLSVLVFAFVRRHYGGPPAVIAAGLVAFLPDVLAHGGITYNDVPLALSYLGAAWALDAAARDPRPARVALAAALATLAVGVKFSAVALAPLVLLLLIAEALRRGWDTRWLLRLAIAVPIGLVVSYLVLVAIYLGDFTLADFREGLAFNVRHANRGHGVAAVILGKHSTDGFWWYFPVAFLLKTPAALHFLLFVAAAGFAVAAGPWQGLRQHLRAALASPLRVPLLASVVFLAFSMSASLNIGFRHVLPVLPGICVIAAVGVWSGWRAWGRRLRLVIGGAFAAYVVSSVAAYPNYLGYLSEYVNDRSHAYDVLVDSSYDWGQGLLALRDFMREHDVDRVFLSYFGSALPEGYGIRYVTLPSFFPLPRHRLQPGEPLPRFAAISSTNLAGNYLPGDPLARFREIPPTAVLLGNIYIFELAPDPAGADRAPQGTR